MLKKQQLAIIAIVAGAVLFVLLPLAAIAIRRLQMNQRQEYDIVPESYWVIGPFGPGMNKSYEPEQDPNPTRPCKTPAGDELKWNVKAVIPGVQCLDFRKALNKKTTDDSAAYALVYVHAETDHRGQMLVGSDDTIAVWVNGSLVHKNDNLRPGKADQDQFMLDWKQGSNTVLIKVGNSKGDHLFFAKMRGEATLRASLDPN